MKLKPPKFKDLSEVHPLSKKVNDNIDTSEGEHEAETYNNDDEDVAKQDIDTDTTIANTGHGSLITEAEAN